MIERRRNGENMEKERIAAYEVLQSRFVDEVDSQMYLLRHKKTGARVLLLENDDDNKVFDIAFRTVPTDSTGVAHIIEHSVLCGSERFPVKDPFVELVKGSVNTFLNAMTYPDKTMYPCASTNDKDFKNLMEVYMDAVFCPNIYKNEKIFRQEGWHYELESVDAPLTYNGVVYNEMKGALSSADSIVSNLVYKLLFPHTTYVNESGGDPANIPDLTYEQFLDFHGKYYHPSNSYIYLYGNMDMEEKLNWMDKEYLSKYEYLKVDSQIEEEAAFIKPVYGETVYGITDDDPEEAATNLSWNRVVGSSLDVMRYTAMQVLEYVLLNAPGAPLKQAILDGGIGNDIGGGISNGTRQMVFEVSVRDSEYDKRELFETIIKETLEKLVEEGLNKKSLLAGLNVMEFRMRENDFGRYPKGLMFGLSAYDSWLYDDNAPISYLEYNELFALLKQKVDTDYYEQLIRECLLDNPHGCLAVVRPERGLVSKQDAQTAQKLAAYKASLSAQELERMVRETVELKMYQETPSTKKELEMIPMISVSDLRKEVKKIENKWEDWGKIRVLTHPIFTNHICYLHFLFDAECVELDDLPYVNLLTSILSYVDTKNYSYQELSDEINIHMGGMDFSYRCYQPNDIGKKPRVMFEVRIKTLTDKVPRAMELLGEILFNSNLNQEKRLNEILAELLSRCKYRLQNAGHSVALTRAASYYTRAGYLAEKMAGIGQYEFLNQQISQIKENPKQFIANLTRVMTRLFARENLLISYTAEPAQIEATKSAILAFVEKLPHRTAEPVEWNVVLEAKNEGFKTSSQVNYVTRVGDFMRDGYPYTGAMRVMKVIMDYDYLWIRLRVKGGAYGCFSGMGRVGTTYFCSYRDPNVAASNEVYEEIPAYLETFDADERDMNKFIIGTISEMDTPKNPSACGESGLSNYLCGITEEMLQRERNEVLNTTVEDIRRLAAPIRTVLSQQFICAVGNDEAIERDKTIFKEVKSLL